MAEFDDAYLRMQQFGAAMLGRLGDAKKEIDEIRFGKKKLLDGCPSRASAVDTFLLSRIERDLQEVVAAMKDARKSLWKECGQS
jgi:hypothetical protein